MMSKQLGVLALASAVSAASLADIEHVVLIMMENRAFDHYFGTMAGVRGFADPNVQINPNGQPVWNQNISGLGLSNKTDVLQPYWLNYLGEDQESFNKSQCLCAGANNWIPTHQAVNGGLMDKWVEIDTPQAMGYFKREDINYHFSIAESYTVGDAYHASIMSNTDPNRLYWQSGSINVPGGPQALDAGGVMLDDQQTNGCTAPNLDCVPYYWPAYVEYLEDAGVSWRSFQNSYNWATNSQLFYFNTFQQAEVNSSLWDRGVQFDGPNGLDAYKKHAKKGTLPEVSYCFPPGSLQEHPPQTPLDGSWYLDQIIRPVLEGPKANSTLIIINWDEAGGWADHVAPLVSPNGTAGEWLQDPDNTLGYTYAGVGIRIPVILISPFTRGGHVFTERCDHASTIQFMEKWLTARGYENVTTGQMDDWRREHMCDLVNAFDFENPDYSIPKLPKPEHPITNSEGQILGLYNAICDPEFGGNCGGSEYINGIPYGNQTADNSLQYEDGFKGMRGYAAEGHWVVMESNGYALYNPADGSKQFSAKPATADHESINQRFVFHGLTVEGSSFNISSAVDGLWISQHSSMSTSVSGAEVYNIQYIGSSEYTLQKENGDYLNIDTEGNLSFDSKATPYKFWSVTYHS